MGHHEEDPPPPIERRRHPRFTLSTPVPARLGTVEAVIVNISQGGLLLNATEQVSVGTVAALTVGSEGVVLTMHVEVVHAMHVISSRCSSHFIRVAFVSPADGERQQLIDQFGVLGEASENS